MADMAARALMKAEARAQAKTQAKTGAKSKTESKVDSKADNKADLDFFTMPFQQILAQSESFTQDQQQM